MQVDPLFVFLVQEYRANPTVPKAVALFHTFCAPGALAKLSVGTENQQIQKAMRSIIVSWTRMQAALIFGPGNAVPPACPPASLFDTLAQDILRAGILARLKRHYRAGAKMNRLQQHFVEKIWRPIIRPHLVAAGFWQIAELT